MRHAVVLFLSSLGAVGCSAHTEAPTKIAPPSPPSSAPVAQKPPPGPIAVRLLAFNDFHGNLKAPTGGIAGVAGPVGGAAYFAAHVKKLREGHANTLVVAAGDLVGASPLTSGLFHDEPTVEVMNAIDLTATSVGNHEFDEGIDEILRLQKGGCHPKDGCKWEPSFGGAKYAILGANVSAIATHTGALPPYVIRTVGGIPIAIIGMTLQDTPHSVTAAGVAGLAFADEVKTANALVPEIRAKGAETIIVLVHEGGEVRSRGLDECTDLKGAIVAIAEKLDPAIDAVVTGHTHALYNCRVAGRPVTSASSYGRVITTIDLEIDPTTHDVVKSEAHNHAITHDVTPDAAVQAIVDRAAAAAAPIENRVIGHISESLKASGRHGDDEGGPLGDVVADAQLEATRSRGARVAIVNSSGVRADILFPKSGDEPDDGIVTYGEAFAAQPFGNPLVTLTTTAADLAQVLGQALRGHSHLQVSHGLVVYFAPEDKPGVTFELDGKKLAPTASVRLTTNSFVADREFAMSGTDRVVGSSVELDALEAYFKAHKLVVPPKEHRIVHKPAAGN